jgi:hypothetical protein
MSSLHRRSDGSVLGEVVRVRTIRLDSLLASKGDGEAAIALWIDAEGMAFETIAGSAGVLGRTHLLHVEVETVPCIGAQQRLFHDVLRLLSDSGFRLLATDQPRTSTQLNALFVRTEVTRAKAAEIGWHVASERLRRPVARVALPLVPSRLRRFISRNGNDVRG